MRISDADRAEVADRLSKHYSDGRLDQAEFDERLDRAMKAKTHADLDGLFADLPADEPGKEPPPRPPAMRPPDTRPPAGQRRNRIVGLILIIVAAVVIGHALEAPFTPFFWHPFFWNPLAGSLVQWLLIGLAVFLWMRYRARRRHRP